LTVSSHGPVGAVPARAAVPGEIERYGGVFRREGRDLLAPVARIAGPAVNEDDGRIAGSVHVIFDVHAVDGVGDARCARRALRGEGRIGGGGAIGGGLRGGGLRGGCRPRWHREARKVRLRRRASAG